MYESFRSFIDYVLGAYSPVTYVNLDGISVIPSGLSGVDWGFVFSGLILCIVLFSFFKLIGGVICKMF